MRLPNAMNLGQIIVNMNVMTSACPRIIDKFFVFIIFFSGSKSLYTTEKITNKIRKVKSRADKNSVIGFPPRLF